MNDRFRLPSPPTAIFIEAPARAGSFGGRTSADVLTTTIGLWSALFITAKQHNVMWREINPKTARAQFLGDGALKRVEAKREAKRICNAIGWAPRNGDEADAGTIWWCAMKLLAPDYAPDVSQYHEKKIKPKRTVRVRSEFEANLRGQ